MDVAHHGSETPESVTGQLAAVHHFGELAGGVVAVVGALIGAGQPPQLIEGERFLGPLTLGGVIEDDRLNSGHGRHCR